MNVTIQNGETLLNKSKISARSSLVVGVFLVVLMITFLYVTSTNSLVMHRSLDNRLLVQNRFIQRLETIEKVCEKENLKDKFDLKSHITQ